MAKNDPGTARYARLREITDKLAAEYGRDRDSAEIRQLAVFELLSEGELERYLEGARIDLRAYLDLVRAKRELAPVRDVKVEVELIERKGKADEVRYAYGQKPPSLRFS